MGTGKERSRGLGGDRLNCRHLLKEGAHRAARDSSPALLIVNMIEQVLLLSLALLSQTCSSSIMNQLKRHNQINLNLNVNLIS